MWTHVQPRVRHVFHRSMETRTRRALLAVAIALVVSLAR